MGSEEGRKSTAAESSHRSRKERKRILAAYAAVGLLAMVALGAILVLLEGSTTAHGDPHINLDSGITSGVAPDERVGIKPPSLADLKLSDAARRAGCTLQLHLPDEGHRHISPTASEPTYRTNPPTSGNHISEQQADGAYSETPRPVAVVHSLEHGRMAIQYQPDLPSHTQRELLGLYGTMYSGTLIFPNDQMPYEVAAVTWTNLLGCSKYNSATLEAIAAFGRSTWGRFGGEPLIAIDPAAPTPIQPRLAH
jgi:hypothetical protein